MRSINNILRDRLYSEAEEADNSGLVKIAENITKQLEDVSVRSNDSAYSYENEDFQQDVQDLLWKVILRASDFYDKHLDSEKSQDIVDFYADKIVKNFLSSAGIDHGVGAYESRTPGENGERIELNVEEE